MSQSSVVSGTTFGYEKQSDGSVYLSVIIAAESVDLINKAMAKTGTLVALAILTGGYGEQAKRLRLSSFFRTPAVWEAVGTDAEYLKWVKLQPCAITKEYSEFHDNGDKFSVPAHIRRIEYGSGTGIKPPYSALPLNKALHDASHQHGDRRLADEDWWAKQRIGYVTAWCWTTLRETLGYESWTQIPPGELLKWATEKGVERYLPTEYREGGK